MLSITVYFDPFIVNCSRVQKQPVLNKIAQPMLFMFNGFLDLMKVVTSLV